jgi:carboxypeptidase Q
MNKIIFYALFSVYLLNSCYAQTDKPLQMVSATAETIPFNFIQDSITIKKIYDENLLRGRSYEHLDYLCNVIGGRFTGTPQAEKAVYWTKKVLDSLGLDSVWLQPVIVPRWERGQKEKGFIVIDKKKIEVPICALGGSVGTGKKGIQAKVIEVQQLSELANLGETALKGNIVFFNRRLDPTLFDTFDAYGGAGDQRRNGASEAAKFGAIGVIVRSLASNLDDFPHTGSMVYQLNVNQIPAIAISTNGAELLSKTLKNNPTTSFYFETHCQKGTETTSYNVIGELRGSEKPNEIIVVGGHLDSWDLAQGAHDDGTGCMQSIEVVRVFKRLGIKPKRTIRVIMYMNEEFGNRGGITYAQYAEENQEKLIHLAAIESDRGGFTPRGFGVDATPQKIAFLNQYQPFLQPYGIDFIRKGHGGVDITPLKVVGTTLIGYVPDSQRYFDLHHSTQDTFDKVNKRELELGAAAMTALAYLLSEYGVE